MGESQYSYQGLPDPAAYCEGAGGPGWGESAGVVEGLQTPNTRARRVVHEVIV